MRAQPEVPKAYLSTSSGAWRVIVQGMPLCADTTLEGAYIVARLFGIKPESLQVWNGDKGNFESQS